ncbi:unnamed protein product [Ectocarpus sp. CCAP 1310/34]|nr:unnamed protein product [Ectocarpus sp. CCAP 1310/34]
MIHLLRKPSHPRAVACARLLHSSPSKKSFFGVAFDIDGVLVRGQEVLPGARESLKALEDARVPYVFVTNGGGCTEEAKARDLTSKLGVQVHRSMVALSHSPMRALASEYSGKRVMVLGSSAKKIAEEDLGLLDTVTPEEFAGEWPDIFHFTGDRYYIPRNFPRRLAEGERPRSVSAVMVLHDPLDWALEAQVVVDVLRGGDPPGSGGASQTPMYISNPDFVFASTYQEPRFAAGAFADTVRMLYAKRFATSEPTIEVFGKPTISTFDYARRLLEERDGVIRPQEEHKIERIYMVGDNPSGDIRGANAAGPPWLSNLVKTGVFRDKGGRGNDAEDPAHFVHNDVRECVNFAMEREARRVEEYPCDQG